MKRLLSLLLVFVLLAGLTVTGAAKEESKLPFDLLERAAQNISADTEFTPYAAKRDTTSSYGIPAPLSEGQAAVVGNKLPVRYIMVENGGYNQTMYTLVYKGNSSILNDPNFDDEPVATGTKAFTTETTLREYTAWLDTKGYALGTYTVLSFTVVNGSQIVEDSATYVEVYVVDKEIPLQWFYIKDAETDQQVNTMNLVYGEERVYTVGRYPFITTNNVDFPDPYKYYNDIFQFDEYHGLIVVFGESLGSEVLFLRQSPNASSVRVNVCTTNEGHSYQTEVIREPGRDTKGVTVHSCTNCYYSYTEYKQNNAETLRGFTDLPATEWYTPEVGEAVQMGLFNGVSADKFAPEETMTRAMLVTVLWRYAEKPAATQGSTFSDVAQGQWYTEAVAWAAENGIVNGVGDGKFDPEGTVTREQMAAILYRYAEQREINTDARADLAMFEDAAEISPWATEYLQWAVAEGLMNGSAEQDKLYAMPQSGATRAQVAAIFVRAIEKLLHAPYYVIEVPECAVKASGQVKTHIWTLYEDGTLVLEEAEAKATEDTPWSEYADEILCIKAMQGITSIDYEEFTGLKSLREVILADSVESLSRRAFMDCSRLESIRLSDNLYAIDIQAFENCVSLKAVDFPDSLYSIQDEAFRNCTGLEEIRLPDGLVFQTPFYTYGQSGENAFEGCTSLKKVVIGRGIEIIPNHMFEGCTSLTSVEFADGIHLIHNNAFNGCTALEEIVLPACIQNFYDEAFMGCTGLKKVTILNPYIDLETNHHDQDRNEAPCDPFPEGCEIYGYAYSTAHAIAEYFGYTFHAID